LGEFSVENTTIMEVEATEKDTDIRRRAEIFFENRGNFRNKFVAILEAPKAREEAKKIFYANLFMVCMKELTEIARKSSYRVRFGARAKYHKEIQVNISKRADAMPTFKDWVKESTSFALKSLKKMVSEELYKLQKNENECEWEIMFYLKEEFEGKTVGSVTSYSSGQVIEIYSTNSKIATSLRESFDEEFAERNGVEIKYGKDVLIEINKSQKEMINN
jgi:hypothetical protein